METLVLKAEKRDRSVKPNVVRASGRVTAVYYGSGVDNVDLVIDYQTFRKTFIAGGKNTVIDVNVDGKNLKALIHDIQYNPRTDEYTHVDLIAVDLNKEVTTQVPLRFVGDSDAVRMLGGMLVTQLDEVTITCLAKNLIHDIEVDLSMLKDFNSVIHVSDLIVPETVTIEDEAGATVAVVEEPKSAEEIAAEEEADAAAAAAVMEAVKAEPTAEGEGDESKES